MHSFGRSFCHAFRAAPLTASIHPHLSRTHASLRRDWAQASSSTWATWAASSRRSLCTGATMSDAATAAGTSGGPASTSTATETPSDSYFLPRILVFGGNGFVGSRVCEEALHTGLNVVSVNRSGRPSGVSEPWADSVDWVQADVFDVSSWRSQLEGAIGVISCLGAFGSNEFMQRICGDANSTVFKEAAEAGVPRATFVSVHDYGFPNAVLKGYFQGKKSAEATLAAKFPDSGIALRPGFIHGTRRVGSVGIPLGAVGVPLDKVLGFFPTQSLAGYPLVGAAFVPPVSVGAVAKAAVAAATDPSVPAGPMDVWTIKKEYEQ